MLFGVGFFPTESQVKPISDWLKENFELTPEVEKRNLELLTKIQKTYAVCIGCKYIKFSDEVLLKYLGLVGDMPLTRREYVRFNSVFFKLYWYPDKKSRYLSEIEKAFIKDNRDLAIRDLADSLDRSTQTIHEALKKME